MREIKFRGKRILEPINIDTYTPNGWVYGGLIDCSNEMYILPYDVSGEMYIDRPYRFRANDYECRVMLAQVEPKSIGQFTGLRDKNGKEIYDGDIVKVEHNYPIYSDWNGKEKIPHKPRRSYGGEEYERDYDLARCYKYYRNYKVEYNLKNQRLEIRNGSDCHALTGYFIRAHNVEVIGNIYDNTELLKGDKE